MKTNLRSPILHLEHAIAGSAFQIAPERSIELFKHSELQKFSLALSDDKKFNIRVNIETHESTLPIATLEYIWCCAFTFYILYQKTTEAQLAGEEKLDSLKNKRICEAIDVLNWASSNMMNSGVESWPENLPKPEAHPKNESDIHVANEFFLCAIAWIIHHEISHIALQHGAVQASYNIQQEKEADLRATKWILQESKNPLETQKRVFGIIIAILSMQLLDIPGNQNHYVITHPPSLERLDYVLSELAIEDNSTACALATVVIQYHAAQHGITAELDGDSFRDILCGFMVAFSTHGR